MNFMDDDVNAIGDTNDEALTYQTVSINASLVCKKLCVHYSDVIMGEMGHPIASRTIVYSTVYSGADQRKHQSSVSLAFVRGIYQRPVKSPQKCPVTRKMCLFSITINKCVISFVLICKKLCVQMLRHKIPWYTYTDRFNVVNNLILSLSNSLRPNDAYMCQ